MPSDWTQSAAKWAAVAVLGAASLVGLYVSITRRGSPALPPIVPPQPVQAAPGTDDYARPRRDAEPTPPAAPETAGEPSPLVHRIRINSAGPGELEMIPGIGPVLAARIVADREQKGPYATAEDLLRVPGIGPRTLERMRPYISLD